MPTGDKYVTCWCQPYQEISLSLLVKNYLKITKYIDILHYIYYYYYIMKKIVNILFSLHFIQLFIRIKKTNFDISLYR